MILLNNHFTRIIEQIPELYESLNNSEIFDLDVNNQELLINTQNFINLRSLFEETYKLDMITFVLYFLLHIKMGSKK